MHADKPEDITWKQIIQAKRYIANTLTFQTCLQTWKYPGRRIERPKTEWAIQTPTQMWQGMRSNEEGMRMRAFRERDTAIK